MSVINAYRDAVGLFGRCAVRPTVNVTATMDGVCNVSECDMPADLMITFTKRTRPPHLRCLEHWGSTSSLLTDAGCKIEYSAQALEWIIQR